MKTISLDAIIFLVSFSMLHFFIASKKCLLEFFFFFNSFLSIAMFLRVTEEHLDVEKGRLWDKLMFICTKREGTLVLRPLLPTSFLNSRRQGEFPPFWQVSKSWESWNVICSNFQLVFRQSLSFYSISRRLLWEPEVAFPRRQSSDKLMNIFQGDKDLEQTLTTFWRRQLKWGCKSTHEVAF